MLTFGSCFAGADDTGESREIKLLSPKDIEVKVCASVSNAFSLRNQCEIGDYIRLCANYVCPVISVSGDCENLCNARIR